MKSKIVTLVSLGVYTAILATSLFSTGCSSSKVSNTPTQGVGQQLLDLDKAYKEGIITEDQYNRLKKEIIRKNN